MIYLGEQIEARDRFFENVRCWVSIKLIGKSTEENLDGYACSTTNCNVCAKDFKKLDDIDDFARFIIPRLDDLIKVRPEEMMTLEREYCKAWIRGRFGTKAEFINKCKILFKEKGYSGWFTNYAINYELAEWLDKHTCTYCNRQYIFTARKKAGEKGINCQFDHWYDKGRHPLLSLSFYNLIPSCSVCNSSVKSSGNFDTGSHLHPYVDSDIASKFTFSYKKIGTNKNEITIAGKDSLDAKTKRTLEDLGTELVYRNHSAKELQDLIDLRLKYSENYLDTLLHKTFGLLKISQEEKYRLIFGIELEEKDFHRRPMSKFKRDIIAELLSLK